MSLETCLAELSGALRSLLEELGDVRMMIVEDRPLRGEAALVDRIGDVVEDAIGWLEEAREAASRPASEPDHARKVLATCQERVQEAAREFHRELVSFERLSELARLGRERGGEWAVWSIGVKSGLERCREPLERTETAISRSWQELVERAARSGVTVQATGIGTMTVPEDHPSRPESG